jgi:hypothetical protein
MQSHSGPVIKKYLKRGGFAGYREYWKLFRLACDAVFGVHGWVVNEDGVYVDGYLRVPVSGYKELMGIVPPVAVQRQPEIIESAIPKHEIDPAAVTFAKDADEPTFACDKKNCSYVGFTKKALEAHKKRAGH